MLSLTDYIFEYRTKKIGGENNPKFDVNWDNLFTTRTEDFTNIFKSKQKPKDIYNGLISFIFKNQDKYKEALNILETPNSFKNNSETNIKNIFKLVISNYLKENKISERLPREITSRWVNDLNGSLNDKFSDILVKILYRTLIDSSNRNYIANQIENYKNTLTTKQPEASGKLAINREFDINTSISFIGYLNSHPYKHKFDVTSYLNKVLIYIYFDKTLRKSYTTKNINSLSDQIVIDTVLNAFNVFNIEDRIYAGEDEFLLSSAVIEELIVLCTAYKPKGLKEMFDSADATDENSYIIVSAEMIKKFIDEFLLNDIKKYEPNIIVKVDNSIQYGYYAITNKLTAFGVEGYRQCVEFEKFFNNLCNQYINNYKGPMPL